MLHRSNNIKELEMFSMEEPLQCLQPWLTLQEETGPLKGRCQKINFWKLKFQHSYISLDVQFTLMPHVLSSVAELSFDTSSV